MRPNPSVNLTRYGRLCKPGLWHMVHHHRPGLQSLSSSASVHFTKAGTILDGALLAVAIPFIFLPEIRDAAMKTAVWAVFMLQCGLSTYIAWKSGILTKTPGQLYESIQQSGPPKRRRLEALAFFVGLVALALATWW